MKKQTDQQQKNNVKPYGRKILSLKAGYNQLAMPHTVTHRFLTMKSSMYSIK